LFGSKLNDADLRVSVEMSIWLISFYVVVVKRQWRSCA